MVTVRTHPQLWDSIVGRLKAANHGKWNARLAQQAVQQYQRAGGGYVGGDRKKTSLHKWTVENWQYAGEPRKSRYLPAMVIEDASPGLLRIENRRKGSKLGQHVPYSEELKKLMRQKRVLRKS